MSGSSSGTTGRRWPDVATLFTAPSDDSAIELLRWYFILTPALWMLGLLVPLGFLLIMWLLVWRWPLDGAINTVVATWLLIALMQGAAVIWNWSLAGEPLSALPRRLVSFAIVGWLLLGVIMAVGYSYNLARPRLVRAIMVLALYIALFTAISLPLATLMGVETLRMMTPLRFVLGSSPSADFYTTAMLFIRENTFGVDLPRMILFYPWPTALGLAGIAIVLISFCEEHRWWRMAGLIGGLCAVVFSLSRATWVALPVACAVFLCLRAKPMTRSLVVIAASLGALGLVLADINPAALFKETSASFAEARSGSSAARDLIYEYSWLGFLDSPMFGKGWIGESVHSEENLPIGSHSSVYGTLYTGGALTFGAMVLAMVVTLAVLLFRSLQGSRAAASACAIMCAVTLFAYGESLFSLVLPCQFLFLFAGGAIRKEVVTPANIETRKVAWNPR